MKSLILFTLLISGCCWPCQNTHPGFGDVSSYYVKMTTLSPMGIRIDNLSNQKIDLNDLDKRIDAIESCVLQVYSEQKIVPTQEQYSSWGCMAPPKPIKLQRCCFIIKVVEPVKSKCQSEWQLLPIPAPNSSCQEKGLEPTEECPCRWRTVTQQTAVVTPPSLYLWHWAHFMTGCNNLWKSPYSKCLGKGFGYK